MKVFKTCLLVIKHHYVTFLINIIVFAALVVVLTALFSDDLDPNFTAVRPNFTIINRDAESALVTGLIEFMSENGNHVELEDDRMVLQDAIFFRASDYIMIIPQGFHESFLSGGPMQIETVKSTHTARGFIAESLADRFLNQFRIYMLAGGDLSEQEIRSAVLRDLAMESDIEKVNFGISMPIDASFLMYMRMLNYSLLTLVFLCVTTIAMVFRRADLSRRNLCAPINPRWFSAQLFLGGGVLCVVAWIVLLVLGFVISSANLGGVDTRVIALVILNTFVLLIFALALASLASTFISGSNAQSAAANIMTLGLCFFGGVFVPRFLLGDGILAVAQFLPTYWNVIALERITELSSFTADALNPIWQAMGLQLAFAAAVFCVTLLISKQLRQSEKFANSTKTELEA